MGRSPAELLAPPPLATELFPPSSLRSDDYIFPVRVATNQMVTQALAKGTGIGVGNEAIYKPAGLFPPGMADRSMGQRGRLFG